LYAKAKVARSDRFLTFFVAEATKREKLVAAYFGCFLRKCAATAHFLRRHAAYLANFCPAENAKKRVFNGFLQIAWRQDEIVAWCLQSSAGTTNLLNT
jgi:hypothetical protein